MDFYLLSPLIDFVTISILGIFVFFNGRKNKLNVSFAIACFAIAFWSGAYTVWQLATTAASALFWTRTLHMGSIFIPVTHLHFVLRFTRQYDKNKKWVLVGYIISLGLLFSNFLGLLVKGVKPILMFEFWPDPGIVYPVFLSYFAVYVSFALYQIIKTALKSKGLQRKKLVYFFIATGVGFGGGSTTYPLFYDISIPPVGVILVSVYVLIVTYLVVRYKFFVEPVSEDNLSSETPKKKGPELKEGMSYLVSEERHEKSLNLFIENVLLGKQGIYVSRSNPEITRANTPLKKTPIIWLTEVSGENNIDPSRIEELSYALTKFVESSDNSVILLEGLPYLVSYSDFNLVLRFLRTFRDEVSKHKSVLLLSINPKSFDEKEVSLLKGEFADIF